MKGFPNPWLELQAFLFARPAYKPKRPGFVRKIFRTEKKHKGIRLFTEKLIDHSRYDGYVLREIRAGRKISGHSNARERARRLARGCCQ